MSRGGYAYLIRQVTTGDRDWRLYRTSPPMPAYPREDDGYVVVSAIRDRGDGQTSETFVFRADKDGKVDYKQQLPASQVGVFDAEGVLRDAGYTVVKGRPSTFGGIMGRSLRRRRSRR